MYESPRENEDAAPMAGADLQEAFLLGESDEFDCRKRSIEKYRAYVAKSPDCAVGWYNLGVLQSKTDDWREALRSFLEARKSDSLAVAASYARLRIMVEHNVKFSEEDFPQEFQGGTFYSLGVLGPGQNAANALRNRGFSCAVTSQGESCSISASAGGVEYRIRLTAVTDTLRKEVFRREGEKEISLSGVNQKNSREVMLAQLDVESLELAQCHVDVDLKAFAVHASIDFRSDASAMRDQVKAPVLAGPSAGPVVEESPGAQKPPAVPPHESDHAPEAGPERGTALGQAPKPVNSRAKADRPAQKKRLTALWAALFVCAAAGVVFLVSWLPGLNSITTAPTSYVPSAGAAATPAAAIPSPSIAEASPGAISDKPVNIVEVFSGCMSGSSFLKDGEGTLFALGGNESGQLGDGTLADAATLRQIMKNIKTVAAGANHTLALTVDGKLLSWGDNSFRQLGAGDVHTYPAPQAVMTDVIAVSAGNGCSFAVSKDGSLWGWGNNKNGQLGDGSKKDCKAPKKLMSDVSSVACGSSFTLAVKKDGSLWAWGDNSSAQLGNGTKKESLKPVKIMVGVQSASAGGNFALAVKKDGSLWTWGDNSSGQLGDGAVKARNTPYRAMTNISSAAAGDSFTLALGKDGKVWAWGSNQYGQVGNKTKKNSGKPVNVLSGVISIAAGYAHAIAVRNDGSVWAWGLNDNGQLSGDAGRNESGPNLLAGPASTAAQSSPSAVATAPQAASTEQPVSYLCGITKASCGAADAYRTCGKEFGGEKAAIADWTELKKQYGNKLPAALTSLGMKDGQAVWVAWDGWEFEGNGVEHYVLMRSDKSKPSGIHVYDHVGSIYFGACSDMSVSALACNSSAITLRFGPEPFAKYSLGISKQNYADQSAGSAGSDEFGPGVTLADWNVLKEKYGGKLPEVLEEMGLKNGQALWVCVGGEAQWFGGRYYFIQRFDDGPGSDFLAHDKVGNIYLGSWNGIHLRALVYSETK